MAVETLGEALSYGWRVTARCAAGKQDGMHRHRECIYRAELDMETLVWTRGRGFPLSRLESRLRCPHCGSRASCCATVRFLLSPRPGISGAGAQKFVQSQRLAFFGNPGR
jgi:hypothetical protein